MVDFFFSAAAGPSSKASLVAVSVVG
jgi:hypothetical protein